MLIKDRMRPQTTNSNGIPVLMQNRTTDIVNGSAGNLRRLSAHNCCLRIDNNELDETLQNCTQHLASGARRLSVGSSAVNNTLFQVKSKRSVSNDKDVNSNVVHKCLARRGSLESNVTRVSVSQSAGPYQDEELLNISCPVLRIVAKGSQDPVDINILSNALDTELQIEQTISRESGESIEEPEAVIKVNQEENKDLPEYIQALGEGRLVCGDSYVEFSKPPWLDEEKFKRGQRFAQDHLFGIMFSDLISLFLLFAFQNGLKPLIYTGQSDTPFKAFRRYLSTNVRVNSWYEGDIWDPESEAHKNLKAVRMMHEVVRRMMTTGEKEEVAKKESLEGRRPIWTDLHEEVRQDFQSCCPEKNHSIDNEVCISQGGMAMTQFGFLGLVLVYPKWFGIYDATEEALEGFVHFWRTIAYLLGVEDKYNLCNGNVTTVRKRCEDIIQLIVKPELTQVSREWMHMSRVMVQGVSFYIIGVTFEVLLLYVCNLLNIKADKLSSSLTIRQRLQYFNICFVLWYVMRFRIMWDFFNSLLRAAIKVTLNMKPERLERLKQRVYPYEKETITTS